jgi:hypothetical protein
LSSNPLPQAADVRTTAHTAAPSAAFLMFLFLETLLRFIALS